MIAQNRGMLMSSYRKKQGLRVDNTGTKLLNLHNNLLKIKILLCIPTNFQKPLDNSLES